MAAVFFIFDSQGYAYVGMYQKIEITGKESFVNRVKGALRLIEARAPQAWEIVQVYVTKIEAGDRTGMFPYLPGAPAVVSEDTALCSVTWCAGAIIHDAFHAKLFQDYKSAHVGPVPESAWCGPDSEKKCIEFQVTPMRQVGADYREVEYWRSRLTSSRAGTCAGDCPHV